MHILTARQQAAMLAPWREVSYQFVAGRGATAHHGGEVIAYLTWWDPSHITAGITAQMDPPPRPYELARIEVRPDFQRMGIASKLFEFARTREARLHFSPHMTTAGQNWAASLGHRPPVVVHVADDIGGQRMWTE